MSFVLGKEVQIIKRSMIHYFEVLAKVSADQGLPAITKEGLLNEFTTMVRTQDELEITTTNKGPYLTRLDDPNPTYLSYGL